MIIYNILTIFLIFLFLVKKKKNVESLYPYILTPHPRFSHYGRLKCDNGFIQKAGVSCCRLTIDDYANDNDRCCILSLSNGDCLRFK